MAAGTTRVAVGSANPVKVQAVEAAFAAVFPQSIISVAPVAVPSGVSDQPMDDEETLLGARNRTQALQEAQPDLNFFVGIEGGIARRDGALEAYAWVVVSDGKREGQSRTASFLLPPDVEQLIEQGLELGEANDRVFGTTNSKQDAGAVGLLTRGVVQRVDLYRPAVVLALVPFLRPGRSD